jgi:tetratricopeptide (TPR) repeat protein
MASRSVIALLIALPALLAGEARLVRAEARLQARQYALAIQLFDQELGEDPASARARRGLAVAWAAQQRCADALPALEALRAEGHWDAATALAEGDCRSRQGDASAAIAAWEEALVLGDAPEALFKLAREARVIGDAEAEQTALDALAGLPDASTANMLAIAALWEAVACDGGDEAWIRLSELRRQLEAWPSHTARVEADFVEGLLWLEAGDPSAANEALKRAGRVARTPARVAAWRAEALRRGGDPEAALAVYELPKAARGDLPLKLAMLARVQADLGRPDEALALLAAHPDPDDVEVLASRWYLARGDDAEAAAWEARWGRRATAADCPLESLVPLEPR